MSIMEVKRYRDVLRDLHRTFPYWEELSGKTILISGASGMLGSLLVDAVMLWNEKRPTHKKCSIIGLVRDMKKAVVRFSYWNGLPEISCVQHDICDPLPELLHMPNYWIHAASTTHPVAYSTEPINTIVSNVMGTRNMLEKVYESGGRFVLLSSVEIYGERHDNADVFSEEYCGYIDCNTLRAGYPEAKRVSEAMCQAYIAEHGTDAVILRLPRCYGPTMHMTDTKAIAQFIKKAVYRENIVLKSEGAQLYSYAFAADAVCGMLWVMLRGNTGEAYNLADKGSDITLRDLAQIVADCAGTKVIFEIANEIERRGFSKSSKAVMDGQKLKGLGWRPNERIESGIKKTIETLSNLI